MEQYYDLVMADTIATYARKDAGFDLPGTGLGHLPDDERWMKVKETFRNSKYGVISEWGFIDFDPEEKKTLVGGEALSYDEYLDVQKQSGRDIRQSFAKSYYDAACVSFKGKVCRINAKKKQLCFERIFVNGFYPDGDGYFGKEDHVWMSLDGFEGCRVGECLAFDADVYRYLKTGHGRMIDFGLRNPTAVRRIEEYELPTDDELRMQTVDAFICENLCMYREQCNGFCIANQEWLENTRKALFIKTNVE